MSLFTTKPKPIARADDENDFFAKGSLNAELSPWTNEKAGISFGVTIVALTRNAVDIINNHRLTLGHHYLLEIPRAKQDPIITVCEITRTGQWKARANFEMPLTDPDHEDLESRLRNMPQQRLTSKRTRTLFLLFGLIGLTATLLLDCF
jgi:hypothetical protein